MKIALIHNNELLLGPIKFNYSMINSEMEELELIERITPTSYSNLPIHFTDGLTHLLPCEQIIPPYDGKYQYVGNFTWDIVNDENNIPIKVNFNYPIVDKTLDDVKEYRKKQIAPERRRRENTILTLLVNGSEVQVSTSREERLLLSSKITADPLTHNYKFLNGWKIVSIDDLRYIVSQIDIKVQEAFDWEFAKTQEIDSCTTIDEVYSVIIREE